MAKATDRVGGNARVEAIREQLGFAAVDTEIDWLNATAMLLVDAIKEDEVEPLAAFLDGASRLAARRPDRAMEGLAAVAHWGISRAMPAAIGRAIDLDGAEGRVLLFVGAQPDCTNSDLSEVLDLAAETVTRLGNRLEHDGLVRRHRMGKFKCWRLTPTGRQAVAAALTVRGDQPAVEDLTVADPFEVLRGRQTRRRDVVQ